MQDCLDNTVYGTRQTLNMSLIPILHMIKLQPHLHELLSSASLQCRRRLSSLGHTNIRGLLSHRSRSQRKVGMTFRSALRIKVVCCLANLISINLIELRCLSTNKFHMEVRISVESMSRSHKLKLVFHIFTPVIRHKSSTPTITSSPKSTSLICAASPKIKTFLLKKSSCQNPSLPRFHKVC
jgi:hypothetical protein